MFSSLGITNVLGNNKAEKISYILRDTYIKDKFVFERIMSSLIKYHALSEKEFEELNRFLVRIGYTVKGKNVVPTISREIIEAEPKPFDAYLQIEKILQTATKEVNIIDSYVDESLFPLYFFDLPSQVRLKILTKKMFYKFIIVARKFARQRSNFEVRRTNEIHDRYLIIDRRAWMIGQSIKDAGNKPLSIIEIEDIESVLKMYNRIWNKATKVLASQ